MESIFKGLENQNERPETPETYFLGRMNHKRRTNCFSWSKIAYFSKYAMLNFRKSLICTVEKGGILRGTPLKRPYLNNKK